MTTDKTWVCNVSILQVKGNPQINVELINQNQNY